MYLKSDKNTQLEYIESNRGNLYNKLGHHGPAIENQWYALRLYFSRKAAIDVYSKAKPVQSFSTWITSYSTREARINSFEIFEEQIEKLIQDDN